MLFRSLCRLCRVVLFLSQFYILSGGGELRAGGPGTAGRGRVREEGAGRCGRVRRGLPPPLGSLGDPKPRAWNWEGPGARPGAWSCVPAPRLVPGARRPGRVSISLGSPFISWAIRLSGLPRLLKPGAQPHRLRSPSLRSQGPSARSPRSRCRRPSRTRAPHGPSLRRPGQIGRAHV